MSFELSSTGTRRFARAGASGSSFIVGALFLLAFLMASVALFVQLYARASGQAAEGLELSRAVAAASDAAERFSADPEGAEGSWLEDGLLVVCDVEPADATPEGASGTLWQATIRVYRADEGPAAGDVPQGEPLYEIQTACYEGGGAR